MIDVGPGAPVRWQRAAYDIIYVRSQAIKKIYGRTFLSEMDCLRFQSIARFEAVADKITTLVVPGLEMKDRYTLYVCVASSLRLKHELTGGIDVHDTAVVTWAFMILGGGRPVVAEDDVPDNAALAIEDEAAAAKEKARKLLELDRNQQVFLIGKHKANTAMAQKKMAELSAVEEIDPEILREVRGEQEKVKAAKAAIATHEKRLIELETEIAALEAPAEIVAVEEITNKYLKVDGIQCSAWLLVSDPHPILRILTQPSPNPHPILSQNHPTAIDKGTKAELVATLVQFVVWITMHSPHMQQVALGDSLIFNALFEGKAHTQPSAKTALTSCFL